jgi:hypothetical protein
LAQCDFSDTHTLALAATYTSDECISDLSVDGVGDTEDSHDNVPQVGSVEFPTDAWQAIARGSCQSSKLECLAYGQMGKMNVFLSLVDDLATETLAHFIHWDTYGENKVRN